MAQSSHLNLHGLMPVKEVGRVLLPPAGLERALPIELSSGTRQSLSVSCSTCIRPTQKKCTGNKQRISPITQICQVIHHCWYEYLYDILKL